VWLAPLAAVAVRLVLDPVLFGYYWIPAQLLAMSGLAVAGRLHRVNFMVALGLSWWLSVAPGKTWQGTALVAVPAVAWLTWTGHRTAGQDGEFPPSTPQVPVQGNRER
jgi:hypothetical protein